jgi:hypothetical protein
MFDAISTSPNLTTYAIIRKIFVARAREMGNGTGNTRWSARKSAGLLFSLPVAWLATGVAYAVGMMWQGVPPWWAVCAIVIAHQASFFPTAIFGAAVGQRLPGRDYIQIAMDLVVCSAANSLSFLLYFGLVRCTSVVPKVVGSDFFCF